MDAKTEALIVQKMLSEKRLRESSQRQQPPMPGNPEHGDITSGLKNFGLGVGSGLANTGRRAYSTVSQQEQPLDDVHWAQPGLSGRLGEFAGEVAPYAAMQRFAPGLGSKAGLPASLSRVIAGGGYGAAESPNDPLGGGVVGATLQGIGEIPGLAVGARRGISQIENPTNFVRQQLSDTKKNYQTQKTVSKTGYDNILNLFGDNKIKDTSAFNKLFKSKEQYLSEEAKDLKNIFNLNPSIENLHYLQAELGKDFARNIGQPGPAKDIATASLKLMNQGKKIVTSELDKLSPQARKAYEAMGEHHKSVVSPYESSEEIYKASTGKTRYSPEEWEKHLQDLMEKRKPGTKGANPEPLVPEGHPLRATHTSLQDKIAAAFAAKAIKNGFSKIPFGLGHPFNMLTGLGSEQSHILEQYANRALAGGRGLSDAYIAEQFMNSPQNPRERGHNDQY